MQCTFFFFGLLAQSAAATSASLLPTNAAEMNILLKDFGILGGVIVLAYLLFFFVLPPVMRLFPTDIAITTLNISRRPLLLILFCLGFKRIIDDLTWGAAGGWVQKGLTAAAIAIGTYCVGQIVTQVVIYYLKDFAEQSEAMWDDVVIPILENILPLLIYVVGFTQVLESIGIDTSGFWVALGGAGFVLGFAFKDSLANFLSGLVLLVDTPFQFGDVIQLSNGNQAIIKKVGLRVTHLYVINEHNDMYMPNSSFEGQPIVNLSRPTPHYYDKIEISTLSTADPSRVIQLMEDVVLAHPDTMGNLEAKLSRVETFYGLATQGVREEEKRKSGLARLSAEQAVNQKLLIIETALMEMADKIDEFEQSGLDDAEIGIIQNDYITICQNIGLSREVRRSQGRRKIFELRQNDEARIGGESLMGLVRSWANLWSKDPDLLIEDRRNLPEFWELKVLLLERRANRLFNRIDNLSADETRLDDALAEFTQWLNDQFKRSRTEWQDPKIWVKGVSSAADPQKTFVIKFFVDDIKLEHCERGYRVRNELYRDMMWHLRNAYLAK